MSLNLIRTCGGEIVNLDNVYYIDFSEKYNLTRAYNDGSECWVKIADGNVLPLLWSGRQDFMEVDDYVE